MQSEIKNTNTKTIITRQAYYLAGVTASKLGQPNHELSLLTTLDENSESYVCSEIEDGKKDFVIIFKEVDELSKEEDANCVADKFKKFANVAYLESRNGYTVVNRYLVGDHTDEACEADFFDAVRKTIQQKASRRGWEIDSQGKLIKSTPKYFF